MSNVPVAKVPLKVAEPLPPRAKALPRAKPLSATDAAAVDRCDSRIRAKLNPAPADDDFSLFQAGDPAPEPSPLLGIGVALALDAACAPRGVSADAGVKTNPSRRTLIGGAHGLVAMFTCVAQMVMQEAPAWGLSMVVHTVTLVTMAMITVPDPVPYKAQHLVVMPPEEEKVEDIREAPTLPDSLTEDSEPQVNVVTAEAEEAPQKENVSLGMGEDQQSAMPINETSQTILDAVKSDLLTVMGGKGDEISGRPMAGDIEKVEMEGGSKPSEDAVAGGLRWLAAHQCPDGGWSFDIARCPSCHGQCRDSGRLGGARNAATGLALLPFLGSNHTHKDKKYGATVGAGLGFLISRMSPSSRGGALNEPGTGNMYSHGIAAIAICEAYAMTKDPKLAAPARAAINFICTAQDPKGGGWRYQPHDPGDTSVVGWQLMALKSGYMAGLTIPSGTTRKASLFLDSVQHDGGAMYGYVTTAKTSDATVAIGLLSRMYLGWRKDNPALRRGVQWVSKRGPSAGNMYYNYYATQVMRHWEGEEWKTWNRRMRDQLISTQAKQGHEDGSWFTSGGDRGAALGGRLYCTAMATMILEIYYRYLPIYRLQSIEQDFPD
jgi:hypothetical protein